MNTPSEPPWGLSDPPQAAAYEAFLGESTGAWTWLYRQQGSISDHSIGQYTALVAPSRVPRALSGPGWDAHIGSAGYGFTSYYDDGVERTVYERYPDEVELLVYYRDYHGVRPRELELAEEFRLAFNLWEERSARTLYYFDESGSPIKAAVIEPNGVRVLTALLRRYQAAQQLYIAFYIDSTRWSTDLDADEFAWEISDSSKAMAYNRSRSGVAEKPFSRLVGKRLLLPPPVEKSGLPPYEQDKEYETFCNRHDRYWR